MSELSKKARAAAEDKAERLTRSSTGKVDASGWKEPLGELGGVQTGPRPVSRRQFKAGGKVTGSRAIMHAGRKPRASGGMTANEFQNRDMKSANESRAGEKHIGGMAKGGKCAGGSAYAKGGGIPDGTRPMGDRIARASGGRSKKGMNVNIVIAPQGGQAKPPMPMPPMGASPAGIPAPPPQMAGPPAGAPPPMGPPPMARKNGGRTNYPIDAGAGGGLGRLEKMRAYGART